MSKSLPSVTSNIPRDLRTFVDRLREIVTGGGANRLVSAQDLADAGLVSIDARGNISTPDTEFVATPPAPTNVVASPAIRNVIVTWDNPDYNGHAYAEVWGASTDDIGQAELLGQTPGAVYVDALGPDSTRYYWVRFVNTAHTAGAYNALHGTSATTAPDLEYTMDILAAALGDTSEAPFFQINNATTINGVLIPAGTYIKSGFIYDGVITNAKIGNAAVDNAKIASLDAGKINTGYLNAARIETGSIDAKIANLDAAIITSGYINTARIQDASIATAKIGDGQITTAKIADSIQSTNYAADAAGWKITKAGDAELNSGTFRGTLAVKSASSGARTEITNSVIKVYDSAGVVRVKLGDLS